MEKDKKTKGIRGELVEYDGETVVIKLYDEIDIDEVRKLSVNGKYLTYVDFFDKRGITESQRNYFWALMGDFEEYTGYPQRPAGDWFRIKFMRNENLDKFPSVSRGAMKQETARKLLQYILEYFIKYDIPFYEQEFHLAEDVSALLYALTMKRRCWICGKPESHLHHYDAVQRGRDRTKIDHTKHRFMMLCASHHAEVHDKGNKEFMNRYHVAPIRLDKESLKELNIRGNYKE